MINVKLKKKGNCKKFNALGMQFRFRGRGWKKRKESVFSIQCLVIEQSVSHEIRERRSDIQLHFVFRKMACK